MSQLEFEGNCNDKIYKIEAICNSVFYLLELESGNSAGLYYLMF